MSLIIEKFADRLSLAASLAEETAGLLRKSISNRKKASLVVSGGSSPKPFFESLSHEILDWNKVTITLADERWVATDHPDSNEFLVRSSLLKNEAASATFIGLKRDQPSAAMDAVICRKELGQVTRPFDVVILGMGNDGHTASLFPGSDQLQVALDDESDLVCTHIKPTAAPYDRITLTLAALLSSRQIFLQLVGNEKWMVLEKALEDLEVEEMPIRAILHQRKTPVTVFWAP